MFRHYKKFKRSKRIAANNDNGIYTIFIAIQMVLWLAWLHSNLFIGIP